MLCDDSRVTLGRMQNPVRGFLHGSAAAASVVGTVVLVSHAEPAHQGALLIFTLSMIALYTVSSLYHSVPWQQQWKSRMQRADHCMIFVLVAGTYTPLAWIALDGWLCFVALAIGWGIALLGILQKIFLPHISTSFSITMMAVQGWLALPLLLPLANRLPFDAVLLLALGGITYTIGLIFLVTERPRLWPRVFSYHEAFHVCVVAGSAMHYTLMLGYLAHFGVVA